MRDLESMGLAIVEAVRQRRILEVECEKLRHRVADAETALMSWDHGGDSEYWVRYPRSTRG